MKSFEIEIKGKKGTGLEIPLPGAPVVMVYGDNGFVMCGYLNVEAANKVGVPAAMVRGVKSVHDLLEAKVQGATKLALDKGVTLEMTGRDALALLL